MITAESGRGIVRLKADPSGTAVHPPSGMVAIARSCWPQTVKRTRRSRLAREAAANHRRSGLEQLASLFADSGDTVQLDAHRRRAAEGGAGRARRPSITLPSRHSFTATRTKRSPRAERAIALDPNYAPTYDLIGAAYTKLNQLEPARQAFQKSLSFDAHDSTAYENLGVLELNAGNRAAAAKYFAEALWLVPESAVSREGLRRARTGSP